MTKATRRSCRSASHGTAGSRVRGSADATITLLEYGDFMAPSCREAAPVLRGAPQAPVSWTLLAVGLRRGALPAGSELSVWVPTRHGAPLRAVRAQDPTADEDAVLLLAHGEGHPRPASGDQRGLAPTQGGDNPAVIARRSLAVVSSALAALLAGGPVASVSAATAPGGSNFSWYRVDRPAPGVCIREPYGVIPNFHLPSAHAQILSELSQMFQSGQRRLRIGIFFGHGFDTGTVMDSGGGHLSVQNRRNLGRLLAAIRTAGFVRVEIAFHPQGPNWAGDWTAWNERLFEENWKLVRNLRPIIRAARLPYRLDLANEAIPGPHQPLLLRYSRELWAKYTRAYGRKDTVGFSVIGDAGHVARMREVYRRTLPPVFDMHFYGDEHHLFLIADSTAKRLRLAQPWIVG
ncbi:MAG: hypothetical protein QOE38_2023, partial [Thermoleophilaceae bacterium]|nr:hypothetical protein [Thermoleophilaceae bacterium]